MDLITLANIFNLIKITFLAVVSYLFMRSKPVKETFNDFLNYAGVGSTPLYTQDVSVITNTIKMASYKYQTSYHTVIKFLSKFSPLEDIPTSGSIENVELIANKQVDLAICQEDVLIDAYKGQNVFKGSPVKNVRFVCGLFYDTFNLITYKDSGIYSWKDIKGKLIGFTGEKTSSYHHGINLAKVAGLKINKDFTAVNVESLNRLCNLLVTKQVDAIYLTTNNKNPYLANLTKEMDIRFIGTKGLDQKIFNYYFPTARKTLLNANNYYNNINISNLLETYGIRSVLVARDDFDQEEVYRIVRKIFTNANNITDMINQYLYNKDQEKMVSEGLVPIEMTYIRKDIPYHKGATKFYYETNYFTNNPDKYCYKYVGQDMFTC